MRELDEWEYFKEKKVKLKAGENVSEVVDLLTFIHDDKGSTSEILRLFKEYQLRQKITLKTQPSELFQFEKAKNDLILNEVKEEIDRLKLDLSVKYEMLHTNRMLLSRFNFQVDSLQADSDNCREVQQANKQKMASRRRELQGSKDLLKLRRIAVLKSATRDNLDMEPSPLEALGTSVESLDKSLAEGEHDIFENDPVYFKLKVEVMEAERAIRSKLA